MFASWPDGTASGHDRLRRPRAVSSSEQAGLVSLEATVESPVPPQFFFRDRDGKRFLVVQP